MNPLFLLPPETAHTVGCRALHYANIFGLSRLLSTTLDMPTEAMGMQFANPIGLAAGLDKNGDYINAFGALGFGCIEVGTVTPKPQAGNPQPRLFRLIKDKAIINRMGFNNKGVAHLVEQLKKRRYTGMVGANIGKNATTSLDDAYKDYQYCLEQVYPWCDYIVLNVSSPNTAGLRTLQTESYMRNLLVAVRECHWRAAQTHKDYKPLVIKMSPDMHQNDLDQFIDTINQSAVDGLIVSNTTTARHGVDHHPLAQQQGGMSGAPLFQHSTNVLLKVRERLDKKITLIGSGGIVSGADALAKMRAGATLVQLYTGLIYRGTALLRDIATSYNHTTS